MRLAVAKLGVNARVIGERPLLTPVIRTKRPEICFDWKVTIFSGEMTSTVDPVRTEGMAANCLLGKKTRVLALSQK